MLLLGWDKSAGAVLQGLGIVRIDLLLFCPAILFEVSSLTTQTCKTDEETGPLKVDSGPKNVFAQVPCFFEVFLPCLCVCSSLVRNYARLNRYLILDGALEPRTPRSRQ